MAHYRGSASGIKFLVTLYNLLGYKPIKPFIFLVALFYAFVSRSKCHELASYYEKVGLKPSFGTYLQHIYQFALTIFDRFIAKEGMQESRIAMERVNVDNFHSITQSGGIVVLSHLGNWAQSFKIFETFDVTLNIVMAEEVSDELSALESLASSNKRINIIDMNMGMQAVVEIAGALMRKEVVIMMADRIVNEKKVLDVPFLGKAAPFNSGPFEVAAMRNAPMVGLCIVRSGDESLKIIISDIIENRKGADIAQPMRQYVDFLGETVREYPLQWFNFYDFWKVK